VEKKKPYFNPEIALLSLGFGGTSGLAKVNELEK
jgi:hypothetical protein